MFFWAPMFSRPKALAEVKNSLYWGQRVLFLRKFSIILQKNKMSSMYFMIFFIDFYLDFDIVVYISLMIHISLIKFTSNFILHFTHIADSNMVVIQGNF